MKCKIFLYLFNFPTRVFNLFAPLFDLGIRIWISRIFFLSALTKLQSWSTTLFLFENEYHVPFLPSDVAAYFGTFAEFILPIFLVLGFGTRLPIFALFCFNMVAAFSYDFLWTDAGACALKDHLYWGLLIGYLMFHGYNKISVDFLIKKKIKCYNNLIL